MSLDTSLRARGGHGRGSCMPSPDHQIRRDLPGVLTICWYGADVLGCRAELRNRPQRLASPWGQNQASTEGQKAQLNYDSRNLFLVLSY
jgi:hypothetical protein